MTASNAVESIFLAEAGQGGGDHAVIVRKAQDQLNSSLENNQEEYGHKK
ncbi:MAG: hypothetical protein HQ574_06580 [Chloroflexi bacterium]|nr:hypothetical protein [Chloroflexota bacterium]